jgi:hypothetical protein
MSLKSKSKPPVVWIAYRIYVGQGVIMDVLVGFHNV